MCETGTTAPSWPALKPSSPWCRGECRGVRGRNAHSDVDQHQGQREEHGHGRGHRERSEFGNQAGGQPTGGGTGLDMRTEERGAPRVSSVGSKMEESHMLYIGHCKSVDRHLPAICPIRSSTCHHLSSVLPSCPLQQVHPHPHPRSSHTSPFSLVSTLRGEGYLGGAMSFPGPLEKQQEAGPSLLEVP